MMIGITGGIGAGKSVVSEILRCKGYFVYDCDSEAKRLMVENQSLLSEIIGCFGKEILLADGLLDRKRLAREVFGDSRRREWLNALVHAAVRDDLAEKCLDSGDSLFFVESAILKTSGLDRMCDMIWVVRAPEGLRIARACSRDDLCREDIEKRIEAQAGEFTDFAGDAEIFEIDNSGRSSLLSQIENLFDKTKIKKICLEK